MSGLELIARDSKSQIEKNAEATAIYFSEVFHRDDDERNWSFSHLREQLVLKNSQELFRRYQIRVQHALFVELLVFNLAYNAVSFCAYMFLPQEENLSEISLGAIKTGRWVRGLSFLVHFCIFITAFKEKLFRSPHAKIAAACIVLFWMCAGEMSTTTYRLYHESPVASIRLTYYIVLTTSVLLPFPRKLYSATSAAAVITVDLMLSSLSSSKKKDISIVLIADGVYHIMTLLVGLFIRYLIEVMNRRAFLDRRECLESKIKIETEKDQEEKFLLSILPLHISREVRDDLREVVINNMTYHQISQKPFNKLYIEKYKNVSILYADIVNSMLLAASLNVSELVETLNDLYGRFDDAAEMNGCMRVKLLGDCYYCVSGVPQENKRHADNCVVTGLHMIEIIRSVREERSVNVDMRIGIHTGSVMAGLLGVRKWQFDIWSKDATIASHMEQAGIPGQVHITKTTKDNLKYKYDISPGDGGKRDAYLQKEKVETFLITRRMTNEDNLTTPTTELDGFYFRRQISEPGFTRPSNKRFMKRESADENLTRLNMSRRGAIGYSLHKYRKMISEVNEIMANTIDEMPISKKDQWMSKVGIQPLLLTFRETGNLRPYLNQPDPLFKLYLLCMAMIFIGITIIHLLIMSRTLEFWITYGTTLLLIVIACVPAWTGYVWLYVKKRHDGDQVLNSSALKISRKIWKSAGLRIVIWITISSMILFCSIVGLNECLENSFFHNIPSKNTTSEFNCTSENENTKKSSLSCTFPWFYTMCAALAMTTTSVFLRSHFFVKLFLNGVSLGAFWYIMDIHGEEVFRQQSTTLADWQEFGFPLDRSHCYYLAFVLLVLHVLDRQVEYVCRLDFLEKVKLKAEQEEVRNIELINRILLFNILPPHVAQFYLGKQLEDDNSQKIEATYHEEFSGVAVLFASIPNFSNFYYEDGQNEEGLRCIQLLNEIICDFDLLLMQREFQSVEKIKTIGSTYMAACGLEPTKKGSMSTEEDPTKNVVKLAKFAFAMISVLNNINKDALQDFKLRIGISVGPVMAGVVGTVKPQYDIWGDTVNVASRMDSTGVPGKIQVTSEVANLLSVAECLCECECRGQIFVKGKGELTTYLLKTLQNSRCEQTTSL